MDASLAKQPRRAVRRAAHIRCQAVSDARFELLGERALDVSPRGMLVACDAQAILGDEVVVSFQAPGPEEIWFDAEAEIVRIVHGLRLSDPGYCVGLRFTYFERAARNELLSRLAGVPPPVPGRRPTSARFRGESGPILEPDVRILPMLRVSPARGGLPAGVFSA
jgi:hypothetical protein